MSGWDWSVEPTWGQGALQAVSWVLTGMVVIALALMLWILWDEVRHWARRLRIERRTVRDHTVGGVWSSWGKDEWENNRAVRDTRRPR